MNRLIGDKRPHCMISQPQNQEKQKLFMNQRNTKVSRKGKDSDQATSINEQGYQQKRQRRSSQLDINNPQCNQKYPQSSSQSQVEPTFSQATTASSSLQVSPYQQKSSEESKEEAIRPINLISEFSSEALPLKKFSQNFTRTDYYQEFYNYTYFTDKPLLKDDERQFYEQYWLQYNNNLKDKEQYSTYRLIMQRMPLINSQIRANTIGFLFMAWDYCCFQREGTDDIAKALRNAIYLDWYLMANNNLDQTEMNSAAIASFCFEYKLKEIEEIDFNLIVYQFGRFLYTREQIVNTEAKFLFLLGENYEPISSVEFLSLYLDFLSYYIELNKPYPSIMSVFLQKVKKYSMIFCKMAILEETLMSITPSLMASCALIFGLQLAFKNFSFVYESGFDPILMKCYEMWKEIVIKLQIGDIHELEMLFLEVSLKVKEVVKKYPEVISQMTGEQISQLELYFHTLQI